MSVSSHSLPFVPVAALGAFENCILKASYIAWLVAFHLAREREAVGTEMVVALDESAIQTPDFQNFSGIKSSPPLAGTGHFHADPAAGYETCLAVPNRDYPDVRPPGMVATNLDVQGLIPDPSWNPGPRLDYNLDALPHEASSFRVLQSNYIQLSTYVK